MLPKTILITGATDGLGKATAEALARQGHTLLLHGRDQGRLDRMAHALQTTVRTYRADFSSLQQVRDLADAVLAAEPRVDVLIANAGIGGGPRRGSVDGFEMNFADVMLEHGYDSMRAYCQSKLAQIALGLRLARTLRSSGVTVTSLHPASEMPTKMVGRRDGEPISLGVATTTRLATDPDLEGVTGVFFDRYRPSRPHPWAMDLDVQDQLWEHSANLVAATGLR